jgi:hypothetical protein
MSSSHVVPLHLVEDLKGPSCKPESSLDWVRTQLHFHDHHHSWAGMIAVHLCACLGDPAAELATSRNRFIIAASGKQVTAQAGPRHAANVMFCPSKGNDSISSLTERTETPFCLPAVPALDNL